jgi:hypothetical protein
MAATFNLQCAHDAGFGERNGHRSAPLKADAGENAGLDTAQSNREGRSQFHKDGPKIA